MGLEALKPGKTGDITAEPGRIFFAEIEHVGPLDEGVHTEGREEAGRAPCGKNVVGPRQVVPQRFGRIGPEEDAAGISYPRQVCQRVCRNDLEVFGSEEVRYADPDLGPQCRCRRF